MAQANTIERAAEAIASYVEAFRPILCIQHEDFRAVDWAIGRAAKLVGGATCVEFNTVLGTTPFQDPAYDDGDKRADLESFLLRELPKKSKSPTREEPQEKASPKDDAAQAEEQRFLILKDVQSFLENPRIVAAIRRIAERTLYVEGVHTTLFLVSGTLRIPPELGSLTTECELPPPSEEEVRTQIQAFAAEQQCPVEEETIASLARALHGMSELQIEQVLRLAYQNDGRLDLKDRRLIIEEKRQFVMRSGMLEFIDADVQLKDIGGLVNLTAWLSRKAKVFEDLERARAANVDLPKGLLIVGLPGCGKSLTAKATAGLFKLPLARLDVGRLLGKYVGESEENMRRALRLAEAIAPCVLWVDEVEKAFSGVGSNGGDTVTTRLFGQFLTWMQEKKSAVFVVATANDISRLPKEFLRKGRFDELFAVDLPTSAERRQILTIHLEKRNHHQALINEFVLQNTAGFSGADLEAVVSEALERCYIEKKSLSSTLLTEVAEEIKERVDKQKGDVEAMRKRLKELGVKPANVKETYR